MPAERGGAEERTEEAPLLWCPTLTPGLGLEPGAPLTSTAGAARAGAASSCTGAVPMTRRGGAGRSTDTDGGGGTAASEVQTMGSSRASPRTTSAESTASTAAAASGCPTVSGAPASTATTGGSPGAKSSGGWPSTEASGCSADANCEKKDSPGNIPREPRPCDSSTSKSCASAGGATEARERSRSSRSRQRLGMARKRSTRCCLRRAHRASFEGSTRSADAMTVRSHSSKNLAASKICGGRGRAWVPKNGAFRMRDLMRQRTL